jgi:RNA polymerase sigma-70 factor (ECF subfamily)
VTESVDSAFEPTRPRLFGLAYRMLGSRAEAEDLVQDAYLRWHQSDRQAIRNPEAWLVTTTTRLAIDRLRALKTERDAYSGPWLPEPMMHDKAPAPDRHLELASDLSIAFMVLLERLAPEERAAFLLHDVFDFEYGEIAAALEKTEDACRQMIHRARTRVRSERKRFDASDADKARLLDQFRRAIDAGDQEALLELFTPDAIWTADGGGRVPAGGGRPIFGAVRIAKLVGGFRDRLRAPGASLELLTINGETGLCVREHGQITALISIATDGQRIHAVYAVLNPDKLPQD